MRLNGSSDWGIYRGCFIIVALAVFLKYKDVLCFCEAHRNLPVEGLASRVMGRRRSFRVAGLATLVTLDVCHELFEAFVLFLLIETVV